MEGQIEKESYTRKMMKGASPETSLLLVVLISPSYNK
jgi:hypothetical protein